MVAENWKSGQGFAVGLAYVAFGNKKESSSVFALVAEDNHSGKAH